MSNAANARLRRRRKRSASATGTPVWKRALTTVASGAETGFRWTSGAIKKRPRVIFGVASAALLAAAINTAAARFDVWQNSRLPETVEVRSTDSELRSAVINLAQRRIEESKAKRKDRAWLLQRLKSDLAAQPRIASYWARSGLSGKLEVAIYPEIPFALVEVSASERLLISREGKQLSRMSAPLPNQLGASNGLLVIEVPELRFVSNQSGKAASPNLNLPWILRHAEEISRGILQDSASAMRLSRISWRSQSGFSINGTFEVKAADGTVQATPLTVQLADPPVARQLSRLQRILLHLRGRNVAPANIDLNFKDKALIQLSGSATPLEM